MNRPLQQHNPASGPIAGHTLSAHETLEALESGPDGLDGAEVEKRRARYGPNVLPKARPPGVLVIYLHQFKSPLIFLLLAAAVFSVVINEFLDAGFIFAVLQINALIGSVQEWRARSSAEQLDKMIQSWVVVVREGFRKRIDSTELVPGDMVNLDSGTHVPADIRLISADELRVDESHLTGESLPVKKDADARYEPDTPSAERTNMLHGGSVVSHGRAHGVVVSTGAATVIGHIAEALATTARPLTPLEIRLKAFTRLIGLLVVVAVAVLVVAQLARGAGLADVFMVAVALAVSAIPEGLPVAITVALSVGSARMAKRNVIVSALHTVEGLGACTLIATDKTGTITCNKLTVKKVVLADGRVFDIGGEGYSADGKITDEDGKPIHEMDREKLQDMARAGCLTNDAGFDPENLKNLFGETTDLAFLVFGAKLGEARHRLLDEMPEVGDLPFDSTRRFSASLNEVGEHLVANVKGAAECVLPLCEGVDADGVLETADRLARGGFRVLAVASGAVLPEAKSFRHEDLAGLKYLGMVAIIDPLRAEVSAAVATCTNAGVDVRMITGDHPQTALAIGKQLGIGLSGKVVTGTDLIALKKSTEGDSNDMDSVIANTPVFARVDPLQKLDIVQSLQRQGHFVAVTGDGVNDAPALRAAHIGVAMGREGTDVAREAADLILTDDNFASIVSGIEEGRIAYDNVRKVIYLLVSTGAAEIVLFMLALISGLALPLFAVQLLWLNLVTNGIQDVALAFEAGEPGIINRKPRPPKQRIFDRLMTSQTLVSGGFIGIVAFWFYQHQLALGMDEALVRNELLLLMVLFENVHVFNCRSEQRSAFRVPLRANLLLIGAVVISQLFHIAAMHIPFMQSVLGVAPVSLEDWLAIAGMALGLLVVMEIYKLVMAQFWKGDGSA